MAIQFTLDAQWLAAAAALVPSPRSVLSPLAGSGSGLISAEEKNALRAAGVLGEAGQLQRVFLPAFDALASTQAFARVRLSGTGQRMDHAVYFGAPEESSASIASMADGLVITCPAEVDKFLEKLVGQTGALLLKNTSFEAALPPLEALALAVLIDQRRRVVLKAIAEDRQALPGPSDTTALVQAIQTTVDVPQWLVSVVRNLAGITQPVQPAQLQPALEALTHKGLARQEKMQFFPAQAVMGMADRMLLVSHVITLDAAHANAAGVTARQYCMCLQTSAADVLHFEMSDGQVHIIAISTADMVDLLKEYLTNAHAIPIAALAPKVLSLLGIAGACSGKRFALNASLVMGRGQDCDILLVDSKASRRHAEIRKVEGGFELVDLGSTNGTFLNGEFAATSRRLSEGDVISVADCQFRVMAGVGADLLAEDQRTVFASDLSAAIEAELPAVPPHPPVPLEPAAPPEPLPFIPEIPFTPIIPDEPEAPPPSPWGPPPAALKRCANCQNEVEPQAKFCGKCGFRLMSE